MHTVVTGTSSDTHGGYRPTTARRLTLLALCVTFTATMALAGPSTVWAATWAREVRFVTEDTFGWVNRLVFGGAGSGCDGFYLPDQYDDPSTMGEFDGFFGASENAFGCANPYATVNTRSAPTPSPEFPPLGDEYQVNIQFHWRNTGVGAEICPGSPPTIDYGATLTEWNWQGSGDATPMVHDLVDHPGERCLEGDVDETFTLDADTSFLYFTATAPEGFNVTDVLIRVGTLAGEGAGSCDGVGALAWGAEGLTSDTHDQWGNLFVGSMASCVFTQPGIYYYSPPEGIVEDATYQVAIQFSTFNGGRARAEALWQICESVVPGSLSIGLLQSVTADIDILDTEIMTVDAPPDACGFVFVFNADVFLQGVLVSNVDGDPVLDGDGSHPPTWGNGGIDPSDEFGEAIDDCNPPEDFIDVPGWLNYGACLVSVGFAFTIEGISRIPGDIAELLAGAMPGFGNLAGAIGGVIGTALGGLADLFLTGITTILGFLFVPTTLGGGWEDFMDDAQTRVPFGWFAQIEGSVAAGFDSGPGSLPAMVLSIGAADVDVGFGDALDAVAPYRGLILGGVALLMSLSTLRWLMAGVGVSPQAGGDKS